MTSPVPVPVTSNKRNTKMNNHQSLNHLLNFTLPPRVQPASNLPRRSRKTGTVFNKEKFVNAQYRFMMDPNGDYTVHFADPDIFFQWSQILQVIIPRTSALASVSEDRGGKQEEGITTCPICLAPPTAPRMTRCGHIFCFPCILHYLSTSENMKWVRCPVCFDSVNEKHLKCVKWFDGPEHSDETVYEEAGPSSASTSTLHSTFAQTPQPGSVLRMRLMQRPQITSLALPRSSTWPSDLVPPHKAPFHFLPDVYDFAKFMLATPDYLIADLTQSLDELAAERTLLNNMTDLLGVHFVDSAETKVREQIELARALESPLLTASIEKALKDKADIANQIQWHRKWQQSLAASAAGADEAIGSGPPALSNKNVPKQRKNLNPPPPSSQTYYFYQSATGLPIFLHPLDIRILFSHFNGYSSFPDTISIRVESISEGTVNDDLRKRCKYLGHMPEGADVVFIEAGLEDVVGAEGLRAFDGPLKMRRSKRTEKAKKDDRARARAEEREREKERSSFWHETPSSTYLYERPHSPVEIHEEEESAVTPSSRTRPSTGAWGDRSFASAAHSGATRQIRTNDPPASRNAYAVEDEWEVDFAWHELEQRESANAGGGGGRRRRGAKMVVLGGPGARRR